MSEADAPTNVGAHGQAARSFARQAPAVEEKVDLLCLVKSGIYCSVEAHPDGALGGHGCVALTEGPSFCHGSECHCAKGFCADSQGRCVPERSQLLHQAFKITTEAYPKAYVAMGNGAVVITADGSTPAAQWRIVKRPDGTHLFTTMAATEHVLSFVEDCSATAEDSHVPECKMVVSTLRMRAGNEVATELRRFGYYDGKFVLSDGIGHEVLYFNASKTVNALSCSSMGSGCPGPAGFLVFDPPLPESMTEYKGLRTQESYHAHFLWWSFLGGFCVLLVLFICWYDQCARVKGTRFDKGLFDFNVGQGAFAIRPGVGQSMMGAERA